jgi:hypothetical protein
MADVGPGELRCEECGATKCRSEFPLEGVLDGRCRCCHAGIPPVRRRGQRFLYSEVRSVDREVFFTDAACAICGATEHLVVDHCHAVAEVRGPLCRNCNAGLGFFGDEPERLRAAAAYLEAHRVSSRRWQAHASIEAARIAERIPPGIGVTALAHLDGHHVAPSPSATVVSRIIPLWPRSSSWC